MKQELIQELSLVHSTRLGCGKEDSDFLNGGRFVQTSAVEVVSTGC